MVARRVFRMIAAVFWTGGELGLKRGFLVDDAMLSFAIMVLRGPRAEAFFFLMGAGVGRATFRVRVVVVGVVWKGFGVRVIAPVRLRVVD